MRAYRNRLSFRALSWALKLNTVWATVILATIYLPFMLLGSFTVAFIVFIFVLGALVWITTVPHYRRREDGIWYVMDSDERAEWVFENMRFPKL
jgi:hypothetical protein